MNLLKDIIAVFLFGALGTFCRFYFLMLQSPQILFPYTILIINSLASFLAGFLFYKMEPIKKTATHLFRGVLVGYLGSFSTFSETLTATYELYINKHIILSIIHLLSNIILGILLAMLGTYLARGKATTRHKKRKKL